jgi:cation:H+ antiporter
LAGSVVQFFDSLSLPLLLGVFTAAAALVWLAGTRLARYVSALAEQTGVGQAFLGMLLLGGITSLPEVAAVGTSAANGNAALAINNLLGTASINVLLLALADIVYGKGALTAVAARPATLMQGVLSMLLAATVALIATVGDVALFGVGVGGVFLATGAIGALAIAGQYEHRHVWEAVDGKQPKRGNVERHEIPLHRLVLAIAACAAAILVAGFVLSASAEGIVARTGLAAGMVGFLLIGFATSLPEVSSIVAAVRMKRYQMAIGDVFGTNLFNVMLIFWADVIYRRGPVMAEAGGFEALGAILAVVMTGLFVVGLLERRDKTILRMGYDSLAAILTFGGGVWLLSRLA